jgi:hypothetical protein
MDCVFLLTARWTAGRGNELMARTRIAACPVDAAHRYECRQ